ncbi:hypothetical protein DXB51_14490 [Bacillus cereus]|uniref:Apea-like HEPN domain-containing protein n=1 Tax=Bacillus luti TaxID=2026191 RepID=A0ABU8HXR1_9BACI|nr:hypothetical protein [Bacillus luti]RGN77201.1 hypothetical protein DXB51_14490 [Bacillus cereus]
MSIIDRATLDFTTQLIDELIVLSSSEKVREFSSHPKKVYKHHLAGILNDIIFKGHVAESFFFHQATAMAAVPSLWENKDGFGYRQSKEIAIQALKSNHFISPERDSQLDLIIAFLRKYLNDLKSNRKTLYLVSEFEKIIKIKEYFLVKRGLSIKDHQWLDITEHHELVLTSPEFFNYLDLINLWNDYINKHDRIDQLLGENVADRSNRKLRELDYSIKGSERTLIILATNFVESYLYYYFYNIKSSNSYPRNKLHKLKGFIQDTQIVEDLIFEEHESIKLNTAIQTAYAIFKESLQIRDRFVHTSAFVDSSNKIAQLQPLLNILTEDTIKYLQNAIDFVYLIDSNLPSNEQILYWWEQFETPDFSEQKLIDPLNKWKS